ncbi:hypothetical protein GW950_00605 [Candidatus Wolfebacteria bacterium]|nr:hypothetical protein [Candidatus Wolfebacteria bacterium]
MAEEQSLEEKSDVNPNTILKERHDVIVKVIAGTTAVICLLLFVFNVVDFKIPNWNLSSSENLNICENQKNVSISKRNPYVQISQQRDCWSGIVDLPSYARISYSIPVDTKICFWNNNRCENKIFIPSHGKNVNLAFDKYTSLRFKGKPGVAWFRLK